LIQARIANIEQWLEEIKEIGAKSSDSRLQVVSKRYAEKIQSLISEPNQKMKDWLQKSFNA
jgi:hypothetical protein